MVKVRVCPTCALQLFYQKIQTFEKQQKRKLNQTIHEFVQECLQQSGTNEPTAFSGTTKSVPAFYEELLL